jgi:putative endonuclease
MSSKVRNNSYIFGLLAEYLVMFLYSIRFYSIIAHRKRNYAGEIDLICARGKTLVFVEVKARKDDADEILCTIHQQDRIKRSAIVFTARNPRYKGFDLRIDLVVIRPYRWPEFIKNAW